MKGNKQVDPNILRWFKTPYGWKPVYRKDENGKNITSTSALSIVKNVKQ